MLGAPNVHYEVAERARGFSAGGIGAIHELARSTGLVKAIDEALHVLKIHLPIAGPILVGTSLDPRTMV